MLKSREWVGKRANVSCCVDASVVAAMIWTNSFKDAIITRVSIVAGVSVSEYTSTTLTFPSLPINVMSGIFSSIDYPVSGSAPRSLHNDICVSTRRSKYLRQASIVSPCPGVVEDEREPWPYIVTGLPFTSCIVRHCMLRRTITPF